METVVEVTETMVPFIKACFLITQTLVFLAKTRVWAIKTIFSKAKPIFFASETIFPIVQKIVGETLFSRNAIRHSRRRKLPATIPRLGLQDNPLFLWGIPLKLSVAEIPLFPYNRR
jgi:hypothetical protein